jgi:MFS family permease
VAVYLLIAFGVSLTTPFVYQVIPAYLESRGLPRPWIATAMTLGQVPEIGALLVLPRLFRRFGYRGTLALGIAAWLLRYGSLVLNPPLWVAVAGIALHGVGIACFAIAGQIFLDSEAPADRRASAQGLYVVVNTGIGSLLGNLLAGESASWLRADSAAVFLVPCLINLGLLVYLFQGFRPSAMPTGRGAIPISLTPPVCDVARTAYVRVGNLGAESADG